MEYFVNPVMTPL